MGGEAQGCRKRAGTQAGLPSRSCWAARTTLPVPPCPRCPQYDEYVQRMLADSGPKWEDKEQRAIGRWAGPALPLPPLHQRGATCVQAAGLPGVPSYLPPRARRRRWTLFDRGIPQRDRCAAVRPTGLHPRALCAVGGSRHFTTARWAGPGPLQLEQAPKRAAAPAGRRFGQTMHRSRQRYADLSRERNFTHTSFMDGSTAEGYMPLSKQLGFRYTFSTDGFGVSSRLAKLLATGQVILRGAGVAKQRVLLRRRQPRCQPHQPAKLGLQPELRRSWSAPPAAGDQGGKQHIWQVGRLVLQAVLPHLHAQLVHVPTKCGGWPAVKSCAASSCPPARSPAAEPCATAPCRG